VFPVRYELDPYILFRRNSVFKGLVRVSCKASRERTSRAGAHGHVV
jgi:hypothetical protein